MKAVINDKNSSTHIINKYNFKVLSSSTLYPEIKEDVFVEGASVSIVKPKEEDLNQGAGVQDDNTLSSSSKDTLIESLLQKTDEMSSNFIKMQMKLESKEEEYKLALIEAKNIALEEGRAEGVKEAQELVQVEHQQLMTQFSSSVQTLQKSTEEFSNSIEGIKEELINAAIDIAKEVILVETSENSSLVASTLASELIKEIQTSSEVIIKVNPVDKVSLEQSLGTLENIKVVSDNAVSLGGVIVLSDAGNIDGDIMKRYERIKIAALGK
ncbi:flagellar assembly protein FliH [Sulfurimonas sp. MAG313]|nr:flagellar assembly protein FliH [Sulfurimonas sp. MAG313]MDF1881826.1 flagellar assembly protein FliH [Sulfurimonas sp. MAG313]